LQLSYCTIRAPIDGTIINRTVTLGQPVAASLQAPNLFSVGQDLTHMLVYTNTDEADVGRIRDGAPATFRVDAFPRETFNGRIYQQRMNATTIQNVVTYNTTIAFDNPDLRLFPGMTAYASIPVATATNVVKIPNGALRFKPDMSDSQRKTLYAKYNITDNTAAPAARIAAASSTATPDAGSQAGAGPAAGAGNAGGAGPGGSAGPGGASRGGPGGPGRGGAGGQNGGGRAGRGGQREETGIVWKLLPDKSLQPVQVRLGVTDFTFTAMTKGDLKPGDELVIGQATATTTAQNRTASPLGGGGPPGVPRRF
jgi:HlyD family secretion protein